jgi:MFS family permease
MRTERSIVDDRSEVSETAREDENNENEKGNVEIDRGPIGAIRFNRTPRLYICFATLCVVVLAESLDATSVSVAFPTIAASVHASTTATFSLGIAFLLCALVFQPVYTSLSYIFGRKAALSCALALFLAGAVIAGAGHSIGVLLAGRVLQGIGGAGVSALTVVVLSDMVPLRERAKWIGGLNAMWTVGSVSGPIIGGILAETSWVSSSFSRDGWLSKLVLITAIAVDLLDQYPTGCCKHPINGAFSTASKTQDHAQGHIRH